LYIFIGIFLLYVDEKLITLLTNHIGIKPTFITISHVYSLSLFTRNRNNFPTFVKCGGVDLFISLIQSKFNPLAATEAMWYEG
jgi:hypothetical protein